MPLSTGRITEGQEARPGLQAGRVQTSPGSRCDPGPGTNWEQTLKTGKTQLVAVAEIKTENGAPLLRIPAPDATIPVLPVIITW